jgi:hypothetical protein
MEQIDGAYTSFLAILPFAIFWVGLCVCIVVIYAKYKFRKKL